jgi:PAS domain S-box-containing protein
MDILPGGTKRTASDEDARFERGTANYLPAKGLKIAPLRERDALGRLVQNLFGLPTFLTDARGAITSHNEAMEEMIGYPLSDVVGRSVSEFLIGGDAVMGKLLNELVESHQLVDRMISVRTRSGETLSCTLAARIMSADDGAVIGIVGTLRKKEGNPREASFGELFQEDELYAQRLKTIGRMAAQIAHEVKNPVASIRLNIEMIESELEHIPNEQTRQEATELLDSVKRELKRLESVTTACLDYVNFRRLRLRKRSLHRMLKELQRFMRREMAARQIKFVNEFSPNLPHIIFDWDRLKQAVLNLYKNAADAMPYGGKIETSTFISDDWIELRISDTGFGIPDVEMEKLFEPFFSDKSGGTGLGLTISRDIISAHGGTIALDTSGGNVTTFVLRLPTGR